MVLIDNQQFTDRRDRTHTTMGVQNIGLRTRGGVRGFLLIINDEGMDDGGQQHTGRILKQRGMELVWGGGGEGRSSYDSSGKVHFGARNPRFGVRPD